MGQFCFDEAIDGLSEIYGWGMIGIKGFGVGLQTVINLPTMVYSVRIQRCWGHDNRSDWLAKAGRFRQDGTTIRAPKAFGRVCLQQRMCLMTAEIEWEVERLNCPQGRDLVKSEVRSAWTERREELRSIFTDDTGGFVLVVILLGDGSEEGNLTSSVSGRAGTCSWWCVCGRRLSRTGSDCMMLQFAIRTHMLGANLVGLVRTRASSVPFFTICFRCKP